MTGKEILCIIDLGSLGRLGTILSIIFWLLLLLRFFSSMDSFGWCVLCRGLLGILGGSGLLPRWDRIERSWWVEIYKIFSAK